MQSSPDLCHMTLPVVARSPAPHSPQVCGPTRPRRRRATERLVWTKELQRLFMDAIDALGPEGTAKNILSFMLQRGADASKLTRIRVANHLLYHNRVKSKME